MTIPRPTVTDCPVCLEPATSAAWVLSDRFYPTDGAFETRRCATCRSTFVADPPTDLGPYYGDFYYAYRDAVPDRTRGLKPWMKRRIAASSLLARLVSWVPGREPFTERLAASPPRQGARVLDIGCGRGKVLDIHREMGWETFGIEFNATAAEAARRRGHEVLTGSFEETELPWREFELVRLSHVLEHLHDPMQALRRAASMVGPSGRLVIELPNISGLLARVAGRAYWQLDPPRHLVIPTAECLQAALAPIFGDVSVTTYSTGQGIARTVFMWRECRSRSPNEHRWRMGDPWVPRGYRLVELLGEPLAAMTDAFRRGDSVRLVATRGGTFARPR